MMLAEPLQRLTAQAQAQQPPARTRLLSRRTHQFSQSGPSSCLLSILATIAAASPTDGSPLPFQSPSPPGFLCPFIDRDSTAPTNDGGPPPDQAPPTPLPQPCSSAPMPTSTTQTPRILADRYMRGGDQRWHLTDKWTLYGSTYCGSCSTPAPSLNVPPVAVESPPISTSTSLPVATATPTATNDNFLNTSVLPAGWKELNDGMYKTNTPLILALSLVLALSICVFMIGCILWRKKKKRLRAQNDLELKLRKKLRPDDPSEADPMDKEISGKQRLWAKATARWKANIRHSARRRRNRRTVFSARPRSRSPSLSSLSDHLSTLTIYPSSSSLPYQSTMSLSSDGINVSTSSHAIEDSNTHTPTPWPPPIGVSASPPAYHPSTSSSRPPTPLRNLHGNSDLVPASSSPHIPPAADDADDVDWYEEGRFAAHVATDDKAQLARLVDMASEPESSGSSPVAVSAPPIWHDEADAFTEGLIEDREGSRSPFGDDCAVPPFPPPPSGAWSKKKMDSFFPYTYEEDFETEVEPSAPPFEDPGHLGGGIDLTPSAPAHVDDDSESQPDSWTHAPSAPEWFEDEDSDDSPSRPHLSRHPSHPRLVQGPIARDGTLPSYYP